MSYNDESKDLIFERIEIDAFVSMMKDIIPYIDATSKTRFVSMMDDHKNIHRFGISICWNMMVLIESVGYDDMTSYTSSERVLSESILARIYITPEKEFYEKFGDEKEIFSYYFHNVTNETFERLSDLRDMMSL